MSLSRRRLSLMALCGAAVIGAHVGFRTSASVPGSGSSSSLLGRLAPPIRLPPLAGGQPPLDSTGLHGRTWLLNVWASWCAPCREEHPLLVQAVRAGGVHLVGVNHRDDPRDAQEWLLRRGDPYDVSAVDREGRVGVDYGLRGVPETFVVDRGGIVRWHHAGPLTAPVWRGQIQPLLAQLEA